MVVEAGMTVTVTRTEHMAADLRRLAGESDDAAVVRRLLALVLDGRKRADAAQLRQPRREDGGNGAALGRAVVRRH